MMKNKLGYLTIGFGFPGFFSFPVLSLSCLSSAQSGSHLTHTPRHTHTHTHSCRSATTPVPKHHPHGHVQSTPHLVSLLSLNTPSAPLALTEEHMHTHMVTRAHTGTHTLSSRRERTHATDYCPCTERWGDGKERFCSMLERTERWGGGRESQRKGREKSGGRRVKA